MTRTWHRISHVTVFELVPPYALRLRFDDGLERLIDFEPMLYGQLHGPLRDPAVFAQVRINPEFKTVEWPNGADFDPGMLHDWPEHEKAMHEMARGWASARVG